MTEQKNGAAKASAIGAAGLLLAFFLKYKVAVLAFLKGGWLLKTAGTMILSLGLYGAAFGWRWALILVGLTFVHEMGHYVYMQSKGLRPKAPVFIPFIGAYVAMTKLPDDPVIHAWAAFAGPLAGGAAAVALYYLGVNMDSNLIISAASWGFIINLLQLVPVRPFDGGFIAECISKWLSIVGVVILIVTALNWQSPLLVLISIGAVFSTFKAFRAGNPIAGKVIPPSERTAVTALYFWLAWALSYYYGLAQDHLSGTFG